MAKSTGSKKTGNQSKKTTTNSVRTAPKKTAADYRKDNELFEEIGLIVFFVLMIILFLCNFGIIGPVGNAVSSVMFGIFGLTAYIMPIALFIAVMLARSLGFDVKKFDFTSDINEIAIESGDNEEFELKVGVDFQRIERGTRGYLRELKYYYQENKMVILSIFGILVVILGIYMVSNIEYGQHLLLPKIYSLASKSGTTLYMAQIHYRKTTAQNL